MTATVLTWAPRPAAGAAPAETRSATAGRTVGAGFARGLLEFAVSKGADRATLLERSGIKAADLQDQDARVPFAGYVALMRAGRRLPAIARWGCTTARRSTSPRSRSSAWWARRPRRWPRRSSN